MATNTNRVDMGACRNPSLNIRPDLARAATAITGPSADDELVGPRGEWWWTGKPPAECPGFDKAAGVLRSLPLPNQRAFTRQSVLDYFDNIWTLTEVLFASLQTTDAFIRQPYHQLRHPMIFYYGHPAVLYINKFRVAGLLDEGINPYFEQLFETGVDEMSWDDLSRGRDDWPPVREVHEYRQKAYEVVRGVILNHPALDKQEVGWDDPAWAVFMGFEHERIHLETSSVLIRELPLTSVRKPEFWPDYHPTCRSPSAPVPTEGVDYPMNRLIPVAGERVVLGKDIAYPSFGWDNEYGSKEIDVQGFRASKFKVTNGEFLRFVKASGYMNPKYWSAEGWNWKTFRNVKWPTFWMPDGPQGLHRYKLRVLFDAIDMRWDWPVDVNYHEARAFAAWRTEQDGSAVRYRLITEAEHNLIRNTRDRVDAHLFASPEQLAAAAVADPGRPAAANERLSPDLCMQLDGQTAAAVAGGRPQGAPTAANVQLAHSSQNPVTELPPTEKGFHDTFGSAWEWGEDHYAAYPGFKLHPFYEDFSAPCFAGKHQLIFGGSFISTGQLASKFARYQFRPHFFQHATFRLVVPDVDMTLYDAGRYGSHNPVTPFYETSCMDAAPPHAGDGPCCSVARRAAFTPTVAEEAASTKAKLEAAQVAYENDSILAQYLSLHYGPIDRVYPDLAAEAARGGLIADALDFPRKLGEQLIAAAERVGLLKEDVQAASAAASGSGRADLRALDLGCAVGRSSFELSRQFREVVGVDISKTFIEVAAKIRDNGRMDFECAVEGEITERLTATLPPPTSQQQEEGTAAHEVDTSRCRFIQGDACNLPSGLGQFDAVLAANLLCRVPEPAACIAQIRSSLRPGGVALLTSPFSWLEQYTDRSNWVGGAYKDGRPNRSADALKALVAPDFEVLEEGSMPLIIREHARKYQLILAHKLVLRRK